MHMPRPRRFDFGAAIARHTTDNTRVARARYPGMEWLFDELDDLRENAETMVDPDDYASLEKELEAALDEGDTLREALLAALQALRDMVYETTHLSAEEDDGSHWCRITKATLDAARITIKAKP